MTMQIDGEILGYCTPGNSNIPSAPPASKVPSNDVNSTVSGVGSSSAATPTAG